MKYRLRHTKKHIYACVSGPFWRSVYLYYHYQNLNPTGYQNITSPNSLGKVYMLQYTHPILFVNDNYQGKYVELSMIIPWRTIYKHEIKINNSAKWFRQSQPCVQMFADAITTKARTHGCVRNDSETHETVLLDCTPGFAGRAIQ